MMKHGFTLVELMIVVAIIGIMAAVAIPGYSRYKDSAAQAEANSNLVDIAAKEETYHRAWGKYKAVAQPASFRDGKGTFANRSNFTALGFDPGAATYYEYWVVTTSDNSDYTAWAGRLLNGSNNCAKLERTNKTIVMHDVTCPQ